MKLQKEPKAVRDNKQNKCDVKAEKWLCGQKGLGGVEWWERRGDHEWIEAILFGNVKTKPKTLYDPLRKVI